MSSTSAEQKSVIIVLRSLASSRKEASLADLVRDYAETEGGPIPFAKFGYRGLEEFLNNTGEFRVTPWNTVQVKSSDVSAHITRLVAEQKSKIQPRRMVNTRVQLSQPSAYSAGFQSSMRLRSAVGKTAAIGPTQPSSHKGAAMPANIYHYQAKQHHQYRNPNTQRPSTTTKSTAPPMRSNQPSYVVTFDSGAPVMQPTNGSGTSTAKQQHQSAPQPKKTHTQQQPRAITKSVDPKTDKKSTGGASGSKVAVTDLRSQLNEKQLSQTNNVVTAVADLRAKLNDKQTHNPVQGAKPAHVESANSVLRVTSKLHDRLKIKPDPLQQQQQQQTVTLVKHSARSSPPPSPPSTTNISNNKNGSITISFSGSTPAVTTLTPPMTPAPAITNVTPQPNQIKSKLNDRLVRKVSMVDPMLTSNEGPNSQPIVSPQQQQRPDSSPSPATSDCSDKSISIPSADLIHDPITVLAYYAQRKGYSVPEYKILKMPKTNRLQCRVMINNVSYSSYPHDFETARAAKLFMALEQLEQFRQLEEEKKYPVCMDLDTELVAKVFDCLKDSPHGMFVHNIPHHFQQTYFVSLPEHWFSLIMKSSQLFSVTDSVEDNKIVYANVATSENEVMPNRPRTSDADGGKTKAVVNGATTGTAAKTVTSAASVRPASQPSSQTVSVAEAAEAGVVGGSAAHKEVNRSNSSGAVVGLSSSSSSVVAAPEVADVATEAVPELSNAQHMERLYLPWTEKYWNLFITNPKSTVDIWGRLIGSEYSDRMDDLIVDIELDLMHGRQRPDTLQVGHIYLVVVSECTYRVRIDRNDFAQSRCLCFYIDNGDEEWFPMDQIYVCKPKFLKFPAQAICLSLFGLEDCAENPNAAQHLDAMLTNKTLIADVASKQADYEEQERSANVSPRVLVALYDTSSDDDVQLNNVILDRICANCEPPKLQLIGITNVLCSHVNDGGEVYCQLRMTSGGIHYVQKLIHHLTQFGFNPDQHRYSLADDENSDFDETMSPVPTPPSSPDSAAGRATGPKADNRRPVYLVQDGHDAKWYRACILKKDPVRCRVFYVDVGMTRHVDTDQIYRLDSMCVVLYKYPYQAIACRLYEVNEITPSLVASLKGYLKPGTPAMVKVMSARHRLPIVKVFIRYQDGPLVCINDTIQLEQEMENTPDVIDDSQPLFPSVINATDLVPTPSVSSRPPSSNGHHNSNTNINAGPQIPALANFTIPSVGEKFEVVVTMASNPSNFKVRAHQLGLPFEQMMRELQEHCANTPNFVPDEWVQTGQAYACQKVDKLWYRAVVQNIFSTSVFLISYCDYGDIVVVNSDRLKVLPVNFRTLPALAIHAKLSGVIPKNQDWETDDCLQFQRLTVGKNFVSRIENVLSIGANSEDVQLELTLVDTSAEPDVNISKLLVLEDRAVPAAC